MWFLARFISENTEWKCRFSFSFYFHFSGCFQRSTIRHLCQNWRSLPRRGRNCRRRPSMQFHGRKVSRWRHWLHKKSKWAIRPSLQDRRSVGTGLGRGAGNVRNVQSFCAGTACNGRVSDSQDYRQFKGKSFIWLSWNLSNIENIPNCSTKLASEVLGTGQSCWREHFPRSSTVYWTWQDNADWKVARWKTQRTAQSSQTEGRTSLFTFYLWQSRPGLWL